MTETPETPQIVQTEAERYAFIHLVVPRKDMHAILPPTLKELFAAVQAQGLPVPAWFAHHLTLSDGDFDFEACLPVDETFVPTGRIGVATWPAGPVARTFYQGDYPGLPAAWEQFGQWLRSNDHAYATHIYERYTLHRGNTPDPANYRTELTWPLT